MNQDPKHITNNLFLPKNYHIDRSNILKSIKIKQLKQKILFMLPQNCIEKCQKLYKPTKMAQALTARLKKSSQNLIRYKISFVNKSCGKILIKDTENCENGGRYQSTPKNKKNQQHQQEGRGHTSIGKISFPTSIDNKKSSTEESISIQQKSSRKSYLKFPKQKVRQHLKMSTIREIFQQVQTEGKKLKNNNSMHIFLPQICNKTIQRESQKTDKKGLSDKSTQVKECERSKNKRTAFKLKIPKKLKVKPSDVISSRIESSHHNELLSTFLHRSSNNKYIYEENINEINGWNGEEEGMSTSILIDDFQEQNYDQISRKFCLQRYNSVQSEVELEGQSPKEYLSNHSLSPLLKQ